MFEGTSLRTVQLWIKTIFLKNPRHTPVWVWPPRVTYLAGRCRCVKLPRKLKRPRVVQECCKFPQKLEMSTARWWSSKFSQNLVRIVVRGRCSLVLRSLPQRLPLAVIPPASSQ